MKIAVLTGASSGLGQEFFKNLEMLEDIDQIWIIARRADKLEQMARDAKIQTRAIPLDLSQKNCLDRFSDILEQEKPDIRILINNAGFGKLGYIYDMDYSEQAEMIAVNNTALTVLCVICLKYMHEKSFIINVASIAAFVPNPRMSVYCSTKAYVLSFTKCIRQELKPRKINAFAVCPGPMATEFLDVAGISGGKSKTFERLPYCNASKVAKKSLEYARKGRAVYTPKLFYKFYRVLCRILPHGFVMKFSKT